MGTEWCSVDESAELSVGFRFKWVDHVAAPVLLSLRHGGEADSESPGDNRRHASVERRMGTRQGPPSAFG